MPRESTLSPERATPQYAVLNPSIHNPDLLLPTTSLLIFRMPIHGLSCVLSDIPESTMLPSNGQGFRKT